MPTTLTFIDPKNNNCKVYFIDDDFNSLYGRIGCTMRSGVVEGNTLRSKMRKGYQKTKLVQIPSNLAPYNEIKMFRHNGTSWVAYGYLNGYYRPLGMDFSTEQMSQFEQFEVEFARWNNLIWKI